MAARGGRRRDRVGMDLFKQFLGFGQRVFCLLSTDNSFVC